MVLILIIDHEAKHSVVHYIRRFVVLLEYIILVDAVQDFIHNSKT